MPAYIAGYNVGTDLSFTLTNSGGDLFTDSMLGHLTMFNSEAEDNVVKVTPISNGGVPIYQTLWNGHRGTMGFTRVGPTLQRVFIDLQTAYHSAGIIQQFSLLMKVRNRDGSTDSYQYSGMQLEAPKNGSFAAVKEVTMSFGFRASLLQATGGLAALSNLMALAA